MQCSKLDKELFLSTISTVSRFMFFQSYFQVVEPLAVKLQAYKTAIETAILLLRIDDIVSGSKKATTLEGGEPAPKQMTEESVKE